MNSWYEKQSKDNYNMNFSQFLTSPNPPSNSDSNYSSSPKNKKSFLSSSEKSNKSKLSRSRTNSINLKKDDEKFEENLSGLTKDSLDSNNLGKKLYNTLTELNEIQMIDNMHFINKLLNEIQLKLLTNSKFLKIITALMQHLNFNWNFEDKKKYLEEIKYYKKEILGLFSNSLPIKALKEYVIIKILIKGKNFTEEKKNLLLILKVNNFEKMIFINIFDKIDSNLKIPKILSSNVMQRVYEKVISYFFNNAMESGNLILQNFINFYNINSLYLYYIEFPKDIEFLSTYDGNFYINKNIILNIEKRDEEKDIYIIRLIFYFYFLFTCKIVYFYKKNNLTNYYYIPEEDIINKILYIFFQKDDINYNNLILTNKEIQVFKKLQNYKSYEEFLEDYKKVKESKKKYYFNVDKFFN